jgi:hypothetical protein
MTSERGVAWRPTRADKPAREVIADAIWTVCSDGNSDPYRVADLVLNALAVRGWVVSRPMPDDAVPPEEHVA